jgi:hypothetical protein
MPVWPCPALTRWRLASRAITTEQSTLLHQRVCHRGGGGVVVVVFKVFSVEPKPLAVSSLSSHLAVLVTDEI